MSGVVRAELRKITTTRLWWIVLLCVVLLSAGYAALPATVAHLQSTNGTSNPFRDPGIVRSVYNGGNPLARVLAMVVGIVAAGSEYRHQMLASSFLATPRRLRLLIGKALALLIFGLLYGLASVVAGVLVATPYVAGRQGNFGFGQPATWRSLGLGVLSIALWTLLGMGLGLLIRNLLVAMLVGISFAFLIEPVAAIVLYLKHGDLPLNLIPSGATNAMLGLTSPVLFAGQHPYLWWQAALVLAVWLLVPAIIGVASTVRRDVN